MFGKKKNKQHVQSMTQNSLNWIMFNEIDTCQFHSLYGRHIPSFFDLKKQKQTRPLHIHTKESDFVNIYSDDNYDYVQKK